jgi:hypothetical protein
MNILRNIWNLLIGEKKNIIGIEASMQQIANHIAFLDERLQQISRDQAATLAILQRMFQVLDVILSDLTPPPAVRLVIKLGGTTKGNDQMQKVSDTGSVTFTLEADDAMGNPGAKLEAIPAYSLSDATLGAVVPAADGMSGEIKLSGKLGVAKLLVVAGELKGESEEFTVEVGAATSLKLSIAALAPAPAVPPVA